MHVNASSKNRQTSNWVAYTLGLSALSHDLRQSALSPSDPPPRDGLGYKSVANPFSSFSSSLDPQLSFLHHLWILPMSNTQEESAQLTSGTSGVRASQSFPFLVARLHLLIGSSLSHSRCPQHHRTFYARAGTKF
jgi:hypothetical protein